MTDKTGSEETSSCNRSSVTNQTEGDNSTCHDQIDSTVQPLFIVIYSLVFLVGLLLNCFIIKFYLCQAQQRQSSSILVYLKNLAAADLLLCLSLPLRITKHIGRSDNILQVYCNFGAFTFYVNMYVSILFMGYIAANRYLKIVHPLGNHILQTVKGAHILSVVTWVFFLSLMIVYIIMSFTKDTFPTPVSNMVDCECLHGSRLTVLYKIMHSSCIALFLLVLISLLFFYYKIGSKVLLAQQRQPASSCSKKLEKSRRKMLVLVGVFCFCFFPYHLVRGLHIFLWNTCSFSKAVFYLKELSIAMSILNICLDPIIYFIYCKSFRTQLRMTSLRHHRRE
ncbi:G-protein coupled receptor 87-like [Mugil cephalus]|uniref:G-protein coupled receptor 87-like n=1 Tax=Mugil cephalus TaxID=48193 RepID=UPI001FB82848|nr:G-protein coupled receptor 87-like [Mugil cephalus]